MNFPWVTTRLNEGFPIWIPRELKDYKRPIPWKKGFKRTTHLAMQQSVEKLFQKNLLLRPSHFLAG